MAATLEGKTAVVTGGSQGIGRQISLNLAKQGASVVVNYSSNKQKADEVVSQIVSEHGKAIAVQGDVSSASAIKSLFDKAEETFGKVHIVVNSAGTIPDNYPSVVKTSEEDWDRVYAVNTKGTFLASKEAALRIPPRLSLPCSPTTLPTLPAKPRWRPSPRSWQRSSEGPKSPPILWHQGLWLQSFSSGVKQRRS
jgi:NAD(P)-dependent dehydrogenase (short-subunit alcohol dehydrogenase family)